MINIASLYFFSDEELLDKRDSVFVPSISDLVIIKNKIFMVVTVAWNFFDVESDSRVLVHVLLKDTGGAAMPDKIYEQFFEKKSNV
jgi:hypothetical protein